MMSYFVSHLVLLPATSDLHMLHVFLSATYGLVTLCQYQRSSDLPHKVLLSDTCGLLTCNMMCSFVPLVPHWVFLLSTNDLHLPHAVFLPATYDLVTSLLWYQMSSDLPHVAFLPVTSGLPTCRIRSCHLIAVLKIFRQLTCSPLTCHMWSSYLPHVVVLSATYVM